MLVKYTKINVISLKMQTLTSFTEQWRDKHCSYTHVHLFANLIDWLIDKLIDWLSFSADFMLQQSWNATF